jgi:hypothetical protein
MIESTLHKKILDTIDDIFLPIVDLGAKVTTSNILKHSDMDYSYVEVMVSNPILDRISSENFINYQSQLLSSYKRLQLLIGDFVIIQKKIKIPVKNIKQIDSKNDLILKDLSKRVFLVMRSFTEWPSFIRSLEQNSDILDKDKKDFTSYNFQLGVIKSDDKYVNTVDFKFNPEFPLYNDLREMNKNGKELVKQAKIFIENEMKLLDLLDYFIINEPTVFNGRSFTAIKINISFIRKDLLEFPLKESKIFRIKRVNE